MASHEPLAALSRFHRRDARARGGAAGARRRTSLNAAEITAVVLTRNEGANVERALRSIPAGAALLVLDAESTDATADIARACGAQVVERPWEGFVAARTAALALVRTPWVLMLDADEELNTALAADIAIVQPREDLAGYRMLRLTYVCGEPIFGAGWYPEYVLRLFRPERVRLVAHPVAGAGAALHERYEPLGPLADLGGCIDHRSYPTVRSYWEKFERYTAIEAAALQSSPLALAGTALRAIARFCWLLAGRRAYADGWRGWLVAYGSALYPVAVHWKALRRS